ncbi:MAG: response regulator [Calditrichaceae bacterium]|nr:response regulator [Calditrichaceae bacterium]MBN2707834.1 response regulator [Calditrichaceae bacterium]RQV94901.1 MAG: response regulator [Calditrichota bacterium]
MSENKKNMLANKKILIVEDDPRNIFSLSLILEEKNVQIYAAENGIKALEVLKNEPGIDLVLMDIMMPGMDGYQTMTAIRKQPEFVNLPIIALTAKAMKGDSKKCIDAGASDYLAKPVDVDALLKKMDALLQK